MSRLKDRIKRLEVQVFGDEDAVAGCTMEELMEAYRFLAPERSKPAAEDPSNPGRNLQRNGETSVPPRIGRLLRKFHRIMEQRRKPKAGLS